MAIDLHFSAQPMITCGNSKKENGNIGQTATLHGGLDHQSGIPEQCGVGFNDAQDIMTAARQKYGVLEEEARYKMLLMCVRKAKQRGQLDYETELQRMARAFTGDDWNMGRVINKTLCRAIASLIPENKWMQFVRLHLNLTENEIQGFRRKYCTFNEEQQRQVLQNSK